ncbi:MAG: DUF402 domain-containing protein [Gemmatimonadota bacterium]
MRRYRQELLYDGDDYKITLLILGSGDPPVRVTESVTLGAGCSMLWFTFPGRPYEVAAFHDRRGRLLGHYTNLVRPPRLSGSTWRITDLFLDIWIEPGSAPRVLDREELAEARERGWIPPEDCELAERECGRILARIREGEWPPAPVRRWPLDTVQALRLRRDTPGIYWAALVSGRLIAFGLYLLGAVSLTSIAFAALTDAFVASGASERAFLSTVTGEALLLLPLTLAGRLPATRWPRPALTDERTLFIGTLATSFAVLVIHGSERWSALLAAVYGTLAVFCAIFAASRAYFDRTLPLFAVAGLVVSGVALAVLL